MSDDDWGDDAQMSDQDADWGTAGDEDEWDNDIVPSSEVNAADSASEQSNLSIDIKIANLYYEAEDSVRDDAKNALEKFKQVKELATKHKDQLNEESKTALFQSLVYECKLLFKFNQYDEMLNEYSSLLELIPQVTRNEGAEAIDSILSLCGNTTTSNEQQLLFFEKLYSITIQTLSNLADTERMLFNVQLKLCKTLFDQRKYDQARVILEKLHNSCRLPDGKDDVINKPSELIEIYALDIQLNTTINSQVGVSGVTDLYQLRKYYEATKSLSGAVKDPRSLSVIRECWGHYFSSESNWSAAYAEFYSAFTSYQEVGNRVKAKQCLCYVVIANMLSSSEQNPFDAREAKVYANDDDIRAIVDLRAAYDRRDAKVFTSRMHDIEQRNDQFVLKHLAAMAKDFQGKVLLRMTQNWSHVQLQVFAGELNISIEQVQSLLTQLILDGELSGEIDLQNQTLYINPPENVSMKLSSKQYSLFDQWTSKLDRIQTVACKSQFFAD